MKVPFADLTRDERDTISEGKLIEERIRNNISDVMNRKNFILGDYVEKFEKAFGEYCGVKNCVSVSSGLSALELSLIGLGIGNGDEVITVANTFNATVAAIVKTGAIPVLVDALNSDYNIDINRVKEAITGKTKAVMPVHLYGQTCKMDELSKAAGEIPIIEDACQAHGAFYKGKRAGSFGKAAAFSFYPGKNLGAYGDGGAITTNDDNLADFLRKTRNYGQTRKYAHDVRPDNSRLDTIQAAVLLEKLKVLDNWNSRRADNADLYREKLNNVEEIILPEERARGEHVYHLFVIQAEKRGDLEKYLGEKGIQSGMHYPVPIHLQKCFENLGHKEGDFPVSEKLSGNILTLPMFPSMREEEIGYVADSIKEFYKK